MKQLALFSASWCPTCQPVKNLVKNYENLGDVQLVIVDIDEMPNLAKRNNIRSIPTMILFEDEQELKRRTGACNQSQLTEFIS